MLEIFWFILVPLAFGFNVVFLVRTWLAMNRLASIAHDIRAIRNHLAPESDDSDFEDQVYVDQWGNQAPTETMKGFYATLTE